MVQCLAQYTYYLARRRMESNLEPSKSKDGCFMRDSEYIYQHRLMPQQCHSEPRHVSYRRHVSYA